MGLSPPLANPSLVISKCLSVQTCPNPPPYLIYKAFSPTPFLIKVSQVEDFSPSFDLLSMQVLPVLQPSVSQECQIGLEKFLKKIFWTNLNYDPHWGKTTRWQLGLLPSNGRWVQRTLGTRTEELRVTFWVVDLKPLLKSRWSIQWPQRDSWLLQLAPFVFSGRTQGEHLSASFPKYINMSPVLLHRLRLTGSNIQESQHNHTGIKSQTHKDSKAKILTAYFSTSSHFYDTSSFYYSGFFSLWVLLLTSSNFINLLSDFGLLLQTSTPPSLSPKYQHLHIISLLSFYKKAARERF